MTWSDFAAKAQWEMETRVFTSRQIRGAEINYPISDKECLVIIYAVEKFSHYLEGIKFEIVTDHCTLCFLKTNAKLPSRLMRYAITLVI